MSKPTHIKPKWFDLTTAAAYSGLSRSTIKAAVAAGKVEITKIAAAGDKQVGKILVLVESLDAWLDAARVPAEGGK
ncbi:helix-turn-helix domain-containing protein [Sulfuriroseicoccus oceanibius]|uniref:Uncharacterized protein n=1 Tax=Sulfuriroseicoccus oceanibius TaxID=2707525 RepID=A0A6B3LEN8_9BACT|nr:helix-turn-helix domain-containing protein [Sulfuriroseicoccus oceanibius]QQL44841.1 hypothetical protein G3M56_013330 [Sulfuriroseicoccus oceanibius]